MKKKIPYILAFILPILIFVIIFYVKGILTGEYTGLCSDLEGQYAFLLNWFQKVLLHENTFLYSFSKGLGGGMLGTFAYYLVSPFNLLSILFKDIRTCIIFLIIFRIGLMSVTMLTYLRYHFKCKNHILVIFSMFYALSLFNLQNYFQIMWQDVYILAPLVLLGIDRIIDKNKPMVYGICLFLVIIINYYMGYMVCLFSIIYFLYRLFNKNSKHIIKDNKRIIKTFVIISLLAGLMTSILSIPVLVEILHSNRFGAEIGVSTAMINLDIISNFQSMMAGNIQDLFNTTNAYWYCGIIVFPLLYFYFVNKRIPLKERILSGIVLGIFILSVVLKPINLLWHAFSYPIGYNYRHFFLAIIFILYLACRSLVNLKGIKKIHYYIITLLYLMIYFSIVLFGKISLYLLYFNLILMLTYMLVLYFYSFKENYKEQLLLVLSLLCFGEMYFHVGSFYLGYDFSNLYAYQGRLNEILEFSNQLKEHDNTPFYRVEIDDYKYGYLDAFYADYYGASTWISGIDDYIAQTMKNYGLSYSAVLYNYRHHLIFDSLFGMKYYRTSEEIPYYDKIGTQSVSAMNDFLFGVSYVDVNVYENPYALSLGYMIENENEIEFQDSVYQYQNDVFQSFSNSDCVFCKVDYKKEGQNYIFQAESDNAIVIDFDNQQEEYEYDVYLMGTLLKTINQDSSDDMMVENNFKEGDEVIFQIDVKKGNEKINIYEFNFEAFQEGIKKLQDEQFIIDEFKEDYIRGNINVLKEGTMIFSIPYDEGWTIKVDGQKVDYDRINGIFIGVHMTEGNHEIELNYCPKGLKVGAIISGGSTIAMAIYLCLNRKKTIKFH